MKTAVNVDGRIIKCSEIDDAKCHDLQDWGVFGMPILELCLNNGETILVNGEDVRFVKEDDD